MEKASKIFGVIFAVIFFGIFAFFLWKLLISLPDIFEGNADVQSLIAAVGVTLIIPMIIKWYEKRIDKRNAIEQLFLEKKLNDCAEMLYFVHAISVNDNLKKVLGIDLSSDIDIQLRFHKFTSSIIQWGNPEIILAYNKYQKAINSGEDSLKTTAKLMLAIRKEMGHKDIEEDDMLRFFIKDWDEYQEKQQQIAKEVDHSE